jgi:hypothetical protein
MIALASKTSLSARVEGDCGVGSSPCPCALSALDHCLTEARYTETDNPQALQIYWEASDSRPAPADSAP